MSKQQNSLKVSPAEENTPSTRRVKQRTSTSPKKRAAKVMESASLHTEGKHTDITSSNDPIIQPATQVMVAQVPNKPTLKPWPFPTGIGHL